LKRLDRNFYMDVLLILLCSSRGCHLWVRTYLGASPQKNKKL
jgi:hypothetical protein